MNPAHHNGHGTSLPHGIDLITDGGFVCRERWRAGEAQIARPVRNEAKRRTLTVGAVPSALATCAFRISSLVPTVSVVTGTSPFV